MQYQGWYIKLSTLDRRIQLGLVLLPLLLVFVLCLGLGLGVGGGQCVLGQYRGSRSSTEAGLECVAWSSLNRSVHSVTPDRWGEGDQEQEKACIQTRDMLILIIARYPTGDLGDHNYCRNPDSSAGPWCYTSSLTNTFDYCPVSCNSSSPLLAASPRRMANSDWSCDSSITVLHPSLPRAGGVYTMTSHVGHVKVSYICTSHSGPMAGECTARAAPEVPAHCSVSPGTDCTGETAVYWSTGFFDSVNFGVRLLDSCSLSLVS